jgi:hypothetical protein
MSGLDRLTHRLLRSGSYRLGRIPVGTRRRRYQ